MSSVRFSIVLFLMYRFLIRTALQSNNGAGPSQNAIRLLKRRVLTCPPQFRTVDVTKLPQQWETGKRLVTCSKQAKPASFPRLAF